VVAFIALFINANLTLARQVAFFKRGCTDDDEVMALLIVQISLCLGKLLF
jgi:hypothetical protein